MPVDFDSILARKQELERKLSRTSWDSPDEAIRLTREYRRIAALCRTKHELDAVLDQIRQNSALFEETERDPEMRGLVEEELARLEQRREVLEKRILQSLLPPDKNDGRPVIVEIRAGTGGEEAALFAGDLFRMYQRFAESQDISLEMLSFSTTSGKGGVKEAIFALKGENAWKTFKYEAGTHRVQRVPETESSGRIHTSAVTVAILPEPEAVEIDLDPRDLRIDTFRSSGPGGQSVNTMDSAVRVTHLPTQLVVSCQDEKSQHKNKQKAFRILRARLLARKEREENRKRSSDRRQQIGSGDRSEKIRTYNFPQNRVTDHRINLSLYSLPEILEGKLEDLSLALAEREYRDASRNFRGAS